MKPTILLGLALCLVPAATAQGLALPAADAELSTAVANAEAGASGAGVYADVSADVPLPALPVDLPVDPSADASVRAGLDRATVEAEAAGASAKAEQDTSFLQGIIGWFASLF